MNAHLLQLILAMKLRTKLKKTGLNLRISLVTLILKLPRLKMMWQRKKNRWLKPSLSSNSISKLIRNTKKELQELKRSMILICPGKNKQFRVTLLLKGAPLGEFSQIGIFLLMNL